MGRMVKKKKEKELVDTEESVLKRSMYTGFIGGIGFSLLGSIMYYFNFMEVAPKFFLLTSWISAGWTDTWLGILFTVIFAGIVSLLVAFIYYGLLKKIKYIWGGVIYGIVLWAITFLLLDPLFTNTPSIMDLTVDTWVTTICLFILYGTFIGYSISYDYSDSIQTEAEQNKEQGG